LIFPCNVRLIALITDS